MLEFRWQCVTGSSASYVSRPKAPLSEHETLTSVVEFAIALAGFSGIVVALGKKPGRWAPADRYRLLNVLTFAFGAGFMAYLPMGIAHAGLSGPELWRVSSGAFLGFGVAGAVFMIRRMRTLEPDVRSMVNPIVRTISFGTTAVAMLVLLLQSAWPRVQAAVRPLLLWPHGPLAERLDSVHAHTVRPARMNSETPRLTAATPGYHRPPVPASVTRGPARARCGMAEAIAVVH